MKLKELLQKVPFDDLVPHLLAWAPEHVTQIPYYKEAYDILLHTEAGQTYRVITVERVQGRHLRAYDRTRRMDYLWELLTKYTARIANPTRA